MRPVSSFSVFPPHSISTVLVSNIYRPFTRRPIATGTSASFPARSVRGVLSCPMNAPPNCRDRTYAKRPTWAASKALLPEAELADKVGVALLVLATEVVEKRPTLVNQHQKTATRMIVLGVGLEVRRQVVDALGQNCDLYFRRTGVALALRMLLDERLLALRCNRHRVTPIRLKVEPPDNLEAVGRCLDQRDRSSLQARQSKPRRCGEPRQHLPMTEQTSLIGGDGEGRDVVQRRVKRQYRPRQCARLSGFLQKVQRNGSIETEWPSARAS